MSASEPVDPIVGEELWLKVLEGGTPVARRVRRDGEPFLADLGDGSGRHHVVKVRVIGEAETGPLVAPVRELKPAAPLTPADRLGYERLDGQLAGTKGDRRLLEPFFALAARGRIYGELAGASA